MNILESANIRSPNEIEEECAHFTITDTEQPFILNDIAKPDEQYTFSAWVKGSGEISISGNKFPVTEEWTRCVITVISDSTDVEIYFRETGDYYFYNSQLEIGEKDTDYSPAPEDLEADAQYKADNALASAKTYADAQIKASADGVMIAVAQSYATVGTVSGVEKRVTDAEALINVQAGLIEQKVDVDGVIAAINLSKGEARIAADKITLAGYTIADAFTCTNLTVSGDSVFEGVLNGATGSFSGKILGGSIEIDSSSGAAGTTYINKVIAGDNEVLFQVGKSNSNSGSSYLSTFSMSNDGNISVSASNRIDISGNIIVTGVMNPSVISWYPSSNTKYDEFQFRLSGNIGTQGMSIVGYKDGSIVEFGNIFSHEHFMPDFPVSIYNINTYGFSSGSAVANGSTNTKTTTIPAIPSGYTYALLVGRSSYCCMSNYSVSGTTLSVTMLNISGGSHTLILYVTLIVFKNRW